MTTSKFYDVSFQPWVTIVVEETDDAHSIAGVEFDWQDSFTNCWLNGPRVNNSEEIIADGGDPDEHPASRVAIGWLDDLILVDRPDEPVNLKSSVLNALRDRMQVWVPRRKELIAQADETERQEKIAAVETEIADRQELLAQLKGDSNE